MTLNLLKGGRGTAVLGEMKCQYHDDYFLLPMAPVPVYTCIHRKGTLRGGFRFTGGARL